MAKSPTNRSKSSASPTDSARARAAARRRRVRKDPDAGAPFPGGAAQSIAPDSQTGPGQPTDETAPLTNQNPQEPDNMAQPATNFPPSSPTPAPANSEETAGTPQKSRFEIFFADVGWNSPVAESVRKNIELCLRYQANSTAYVLSKDQCVALFRMHPSMIGTEPSIIVIDREACAAKRKQGYGFKLNLGLIRDAPTANNLVKWVLAVLAEQKPGSDITEPIRTVFHKEGLRGAVDILADITRSPVGEAATH